MIPSFLFPFLLVSRSVLFPLCATYIPAIWSEWIPWSRKYSSGGRRPGNRVIYPLCLRFHAPGGSRLMCRDRSRLLFSPLQQECFTGQVGHGRARQSIYNHSVARDRPRTVAYLLPVPCMTSEVIEHTASKALPRAPE